MPNVPEVKPPSSHWFDTLVTGVTNMAEVLEFIFPRETPAVRRRKKKNLRRITGQLCQTTQDTEMTSTNPTLWCAPHKIPLSSTVIERRAEHNWASASWSSLRFWNVLSLTLCLTETIVCCFTVAYNINQDTFTCWPLTHTHIQPVGFLRTSCHMGKNKIKN